MLIEFKGSNFPVYINPAFVTAVREHQSLEQYTLIFVCNKNDPEIVLDHYEDVVRRLNESEGK